MKITKREEQMKGITLVALVITIVILLILSSAIMNLVLGDESLFYRTKDAIIKNEYATVKEAVIGKIDSNYVKHYNETSENKINATTQLFNEGYIEYDYKLNLEKFNLRGLEKGYGTTDTGDYYSLKGEKLTYIDKEFREILISELKGIGDIPINLYFTSHIDKDNIKLDLSMESSIKLTLKNHQNEDITYEDIVYEIELKDKEKSSLDVVIENINLTQENYKGTIKGKEKQIKEADLQLKVKNGKSLSSETVELEINLEKPIKVKKVLKIEVLNDNIIDYSGNNYHGKLISGAKIIRDEENNCAIQLDGIDDFVQLPTISGNFSWKNGMKIEAIVNIEEKDANMGLLTLGNGLSSSGVGQSHIIIQMVDNKIKFEAQGGKELLVYHTNYSDNTTPANQKVNISINMDTNFWAKYYSEIMINGNKKSGDGSGEMFKTITPIRGIDRTQNYIGKSYWQDANNFKGKIYYLKLTTTDGQKIFEYDLNHVQ